MLLLLLVGILKLLFALGEGLLQTVDGGPCSDRLLAVDLELVLKCFDRLLGFDALALFSGQLGCQLIISVLELVGFLGQCCQLCLQAL